MNMFNLIPITAELELGTRVPLVGPLLDRVLRRVLAGRLSALQAHMREEGQNLRALLERQWRCRPNADD